jgi:hypothetical protein
MSPIVGHLVANNEGLSPIEQFQVLHSKANQCSTSTRAMLLTTYLKWLNLFPEIRTQILEVFERYSHVLDAELQQRACKYAFWTKTTALFLKHFFSRLSTMNLFIHKFA